VSIRATIRNRCPSARILAAAAATAGLLALAGCGSVQVGRDFNAESFATRVERGVTRQTDVRAWLGSPSSTGVTVEADGRRLTKWTYYFGRGRLPGLADLRFKLLEIHFDADGVVQSYTWSD
jgi:outer membrane protein assembly factor BamE (lipoprotein component of BamABCDE complex)